MGFAYPVKCVGVVISNAYILLNPKIYGTRTVESIRIYITIIIYANDHSDLYNLSRIFRNTVLCSEHNIIGSSEKYLTV